MRLGVSSYTFVWAAGVPGYEVPVHPLTPEELLNKAVALGVHVVQIGDNIPLGHLPGVQADRLRMRAEQLKIEIELGTRGIHPDHLRSYLCLARRLNSRLLRVVTDNRDDRPSAAEVADALRLVVVEFERAAVQIAIENHDRFTSGTLREIVDTVGSKQVGICFDTANSFGCLEGPEAVLECLAPLVISLHVKDFWVRRLPHKFGFIVEGRPAGQGHLDIPRLLEKLKQAGRDPNAIVEQWPPPEATLEKSIRKEEQWAISGIQYLRQFIPD
jgi:3-oxoisoapionate decarboxylase